MNVQSYSFPEVILNPGDVREVEVRLDGPFRAQKLAMQGFMEDVRGHFKLRYSRLPLLNRENVIAYSNVTRFKSKRRTTVEYRYGTEGNFVRSYLPKNVIYVPTDPLSYVDLLQIRVGREPALTAPSVPAAFFGTEVFGNGFPMPTGQAAMAIKLELRNRGDIQVRVFAMVLGVGMAARP